MKVLPMSVGSPVASYRMKPFSSEVCKSADLIKLMTQPTEAAPLGRNDRKKRPCMYSEDLGAG